MQNPDIPVIQVPIEFVSELAPLFQKGIRIDIETGCTVKSLLMEQWSIPSDYISERISTLFLNGKPVDDIEKTRVRKGAVLALSSAMPGLVGAVMRRGGFYASLRSGITYHQTTVDAGIQTGTITVKLFNLLIGELGPGFVRRGFRADFRDVRQAIPNLPESSKLSAELSAGEVLVTTSSS